MNSFFKKHWAEVLLFFITLAYVAYFSWFTVLRYQTLWAHYFDLGIMQQAVYNTYMSLKTGDFSRFLELTNPHGFDQIRRMAVHNDILLAFLAPLYFVYSGPETLLIVQTLVVSIGALALFYIAHHVLKKSKYVNILSLLFSFSYLLYPPLQRSNQFEFHAVVLATTLLLCMYLFWLKKKYMLSGIFLVLSLFSKEQVGLSTCLFGAYILIRSMHKKKNKYDSYFSLFVIVFSFFWVAFSFIYIIPHFRQFGKHFAVERYTDFGETPVQIMIGIVKKPQLLSSYIFQKNTFQYIVNLFGPLAFLPLLSPLHVAIVIPEFAINLLSKEQSMTNIYYQYTAVITPFLFIASVEGIRKLIESKKTIISASVCLIAASVVFSFFISPLPYSRMKEVYPILYPAQESKDAFTWQKKLINESIKVMATGHIAPVFASRRYLYLFSNRYDLADYVVLSVDEVYNSNDNVAWKKVYEKLVADKTFRLVFKNKNFEVYKKI